jgi:K+-sensing histidine kinase KdpD
MGGNMNNLVRSMVHDVRNHLSPAMGYLDILEKLGTNLSPDQKIYIHLARSGMHLVLTSINKFSEEVKARI